MFSLFRCSTSIGRLSIPVLSLSLVACTTVSAPSRFVERSYEVGVEREATPGEDLFLVRRGQRLEASVFVGLVFGGSVKDTWEQEIEEDQLLFEGADGNALKCTYRHSQIPAKAIDIKSRRNPTVRSPYDKVAGGATDNTIRPMQVEVPGGNGPLSYAGVEIQILELAPKRVRYRIVSDPFGEGDPPAPVEAGTPR